MRKYIELVKQTFYFDTPDFQVENQELLFHGIPLMPIIEQYGTPLRLTYLPKISENIERAKRYFSEPMKKLNYKGEYVYCYCTKSSHFSFVVEEAIKSGAHIETSSSFDVEIVQRLHQKQLIDKNTFILGNGFKREVYKENLKGLIEAGFHNCIPILDTRSEIEAYENTNADKVSLGIRIATDEQPDFEFYTSRLGIRYRDALDFYKNKIQHHEKFELRLLHFFVNSGIKDSVYFWSELNKFIYKYCELKKICPELNILDIGGGFPIKTSLGFEYDYEYMAGEIIRAIKEICDEEGVETPHVFSEFGSFTVGETGAMIFSVLEQKQQNDKELWYMIDGSIITHLPDIWASGQKFIMLAVNNWENNFTQVHIGGITCDGMDYYNSEVHIGKVMLPKFKRDEPMYIGFFNTGAYQESLSGYGGIQHCLVPAAKHVVINKDENGNISTKLFSQEQDSDGMMRILGY
ncbi:MAG: arginine decarboxylase [Bernardetiaceae bacterium]|nr:arginine decarboxylase [Bernardetiaceae bacterium]